MKVENQVCTLEQAKKLKLLGVSQDSFFSWCGNEAHVPDGSDKPWVWVGITLPVNSQEEGHRSLVPSASPFAAAFTVGELGIMLNSEEYTYRDGSEDSEYANWSWANDAACKAGGAFGTEAEARTNRLIKLIEDEGLSVSEINERLLKS